MEEGAGEPGEAERGAQVEEGGVRLGGLGLAAGPVLASQFLTESHKLVFELGKVPLQSS